MEDIIGFEEQIGANFKRVIKQARTTPVKAATIAPAPIRKAPAPVKVQTAKAKVLDRAIATRIKTGKPIPAPIKKAIDNRIKTGKNLPPAIKQAVKIKKPVAVKKTAPAQIPVKRKLIAAKQKATATAIVKRKEQTKKPIPVKALTKVTAPIVVKQATPVQRSYMPVDLPYQAPFIKNSSIKIPATKIKLTTDVDLIQPPVDAGTLNYYGK